jgi:hypothetical protein
MGCSCDIYRRGFLFLLASVRIHFEANLHLPLLFGDAFPLLGFGVLD